MPKRRRRSSSSTASSRSSASSSSSVRSALRVTRNAAHSSTTMPDEQRVQVGGDDLLDRHEASPSASGDQPREHVGHLDPGEAPLAGLGVGDHRGEAERQVGDVRERVRRVDGERREHREDPLLVDLGHGARGRSAIEVVPADDLDAARPRAPGRSSSRKMRSWSGDQLARPRRRSRSAAAAGCSPSGGRRRRRPPPPGPCSAATRTWKNSSRLVEKIAQNFDPLEQRDRPARRRAASTRSLNSQPAQLAVEEPCRRWRQVVCAPASPAVRGGDRIASSRAAPRVTLRRRSGMPEVPLDRDQLALGVADDALAVAAELRVVTGQQHEPGEAHGPGTRRAPCARPSRRRPPSAVTPDRGRRCGRGPAARLLRRRRSWRRVYRSIGRQDSAGAHEGRPRRAWHAGSR